MGWKHYRLLFRLESPLHVGYRKVGNLMQTRRYVPGKNLWAAMTVRIVWLAGQGNSARAYQAVGEALKKHFRFGYLWPAHATEKDEHSLWVLPTRPRFPWEEARWDYLYLDSQVRTAIDPGTRTAVEGMLYDVEYIMSYTREGEPVYLVGDLWVRNEMPPAVDVNGTTIPLRWQEALQRLQIGGERTYGWGRVRCCTDWDEKQEGSGQTVAGYHWNEQNEEVVLTLSKDNDKDKARLTAHAKAVGSDALSGIAGPIEPLVGWERNNDANAKNPWKLSSAGVCWAPGGRVEREVKVRIGEYGIWEAV